MTMSQTATEEVKGTDGKDYAVTVTFDVTSVAPLSSPTEPPIEPPSETGSIPLTWNDARFSGCTTSNSVTVQNGATLSSKSITDTGHTASIILGSGGATVRTCRVNSRESLRVGASGTFNIDNCYLEATGQGDDHADTVQHYSPGSRGTVRVTNTSIVAHNTAATAGFFVADNWTGTFELTNVVIQGGPYGCRIHPDTGGDNIIRFRNVFFVGPFGYGPYLFGNYGGHRNIFEVWENVCWATIQNGVLVPGKAIPKPASTEVHSESMTKERAVKEMQAGTGKP
jgi:hypothetical protein